jgi:hypothetical protein
MSEIMLGNGPHQHALTFADLGLPPGNPQQAAELIEARMRAGTIEIVTCSNRRYVINWANVQLASIG